MVYLVVRDCAGASCDQLLHGDILDVLGNHYHCDATVGGLFSDSVCNDVWSGSEQAMLLDPVLRGTG